MRRLGRGGEVEHGRDPTSPRLAGLPFPAGHLHLPLGVTVKAKNDGFGCRPLDFINPHGTVLVVRRLALDAK
jgi:hypothetical protein